MVKFRVSLCVLLVILLFTQQMNSQSQENNENRNRSIIFQNKIGFSDYQIQNTSKNTALMYGVSLTKDFYLTNNIYLNTGIGLDNYSFNQYINNIDYHSNSKFINVPLKIKFLKEHNKNSFFTSVGIVSSYKIFEEFEDVILDTKLSGEKGYNFSSNINFGFNYFFSEKMTMMIALDYLSDFAQSGYNNDTVRNNQISIVLGFDFKI